ncbi:hypothetical protein BJ508DRAFT_218461, partial [Ascobolus immersus RN42]
RCKKPKAYSTEHSRVVTHHSTTPATRSLTRGEQTGSRIAFYLWPYRYCAAEQLYGASRLSGAGGLAPNVGFTFVDYWEQLVQVVLSVGNSTRSQQTVTCQWSVEGYRDRSMSFGLLFRA